jgi:hypothetical protein
MYLVPERRYLAFSLFDVVLGLFQVEPDAADGESGDIGPGEEAG